MRLAFPLVLSLALLVPVPGHAEGEPDLAAASTVPPTPPPSPAEIRRVSDPSSDRGVILPSAETLPAGKISLTSYYLILNTLSGGVTDRLQLSATVPTPFISFGSTLGLSAKVRIYAGPRTRMSVQGSAWATRSSDESWENSTVSPGLGVFIDRVLDDPGRFSVSLGGLAFLPYGSNTAKAFLGAAGVSARFAQQAKLVAEVIVPTNFEPDIFDETRNLSLVSYGVRVFSERASLDVVMVRPMFFEFGAGGWETFGFPLLVVGLKS